VLNDTPVSMVPYIVMLPLGDAEDEAPSTFAHAAHDAATMQTSHWATMRTMMHLSLLNVRQKVILTRQPRRGGADTGPSPPRLLQSYFHL
jgi:hypothetical protein